MKIGKEHHDVQVEGIIKSKNFRIAATAESFRILSSGLYQNKARAITRELGTNAVDSHIAAGKADVPFVVHLPNYIEPQWKIRDFGTGLSDKQIQTLYTTYFESDKTESNDVTGCFGLGSKSPFSYTDSFSIASYQNGRKSKWTAFIDEDGIPAMAYVGAEPTKEADGLEISFAVKVHDIHDFKREAEYVYKFFRVRPTIVGANIVWPERTEVYKFSGKDWKAYNSRYTNNGNIVIMGNVGYPLDWSTAGVSDRLITSMTIEFDIPIGSVDITASRESLEYTKRTKAYLQQRATEIAKEIAEVVGKELDTKTCLWDACAFYAENSLFLGTHKRLWQGKDITDSYSGNTQIPYINIERRYSGNLKKNTHADGFKQYYRQSREEVKFFIQDLGKGWERRTKGWMRSNSSVKNAIVLEPFADADEQAKFFEVVGCPDESILCSTLPKVVYEKNPDSTYTKKKYSGVFKFNGGNKKSYAWTEDKEATEGYYVPIDGYEPTTMSFYEFLRKVESFYSLEPDTRGKVFGIRKYALEKIEEDSNWIPLTKALEDATIKREADIVMAANLDEWRRVKTFSEYESSNPEMIAFINKAKQFVKREDDYDNLHRVMDDSDIEAKKTDEVKKFIKSIRKSYPLLHHWFKYEIDDECTSDYEGHAKPKAKLVNHYIKLVEKEGEDYNG